MSKPTHVIIPEDVKNNAKINAIELGMSFQDYLAEALREKVEKNEKRKPGRGRKVD